MFPVSISLLSYSVLISHSHWRYFAWILISPSSLRLCCHIKGEKDYMGKSRLIKHCAQPQVDLLLCIRRPSLLQFSRLIMCTHRVSGIPGDAEQYGTLCVWMSMYTRNVINNQGIRGAFLNSTTC